MEKEILEEDYPYTLGDGNDEVCEDIIELCHICNSFHEIHDDCDIDDLEDIF